MAVLNARQERFAQLVVSGKPACVAYELAGYRPDRGGAVHLAANPRVAARIAELQEEAAQRAKITRGRLIVWLSRVIEREGVSVRDQLRAADQLARMCGWNEPERVVHSGEITVSHEVRARLDSLLGVGEGAPALPAAIEAEAEVMPAGTEGQEA